MKSLKGFGRQRARPNESLENRWLVQEFFVYIVDSNIPRVCSNNIEDSKLEDIVEKGSEVKTFSK